MSFIHVDYDAFGRIENHLINWTMKMKIDLIFTLFQIFHTRLRPPPYRWVSLLRRVDITMLYRNRSLNSIINLQSEFI